MTLDHATGLMDGEVTTGPERGAWLSRLGAPELQALAARFEAEGDEDSLSLLLAWMERHRRPRDSASASSEGAMTEAEAYRVLGLAEGASVEEVRAAYRRLIRKVHPDLGGSSALAALLNAAKERLDPS
jgi:DnaJ-domain-containing protein 1